MFHAIIPAAAGIGAQSSRAEMEQFAGLVPDVTDFDLPEFAFRSQQ